MSRAFVNEDDQREAPFVPPRADLPEGVPNYVTPAGMEALVQEKEALLARLKELVNGDELDKQNAISIVNTRIQMLENRIVTAQIIRKDGPTGEEVTFGSVISLQIGETGKVQKFQIVGVDEADLKQGKIAFTSPLARLLMNRKAGETVHLDLGRSSRMFKILEVL